MPTFVSQFVYEFFGLLFARLIINGHALFFVDYVSYVREWMTSCWIIEFYEDFHW